MVAHPLATRPAVPQPPSTHLMVCILSYLFTDIKHRAGIICLLSKFHHTFLKMDAWPGPFNVCLDFCRLSAGSRIQWDFFRTSMRLKKKATFIALQNRIPCLLSNGLQTSYSLHKTLYLAALCILDALAG